MGEKKKSTKPQPRCSLLFVGLCLTHPQVKRRNALKLFSTSNAIEIGTKFNIFSQYFYLHIEFKGKKLRSEKCLSAEHLFTALCCCCWSKWRHEEVTRCQKVIVLWTGTKHFGELLLLGICFQDACSSYALRIWYEDDFVQSGMKI